MRCLGLILLFIIFGIGCTSKKEAAPIIIPAGGLIQFTNSEFVKVSEEFYNLELRRVDSQSNESYSIADLTPSDSKTEIQQRSYILPKDKNELGFFIVQANLTKLNLQFKAFAIEGEVAAPGFVSTIVVDLIMNYPNKTLSEYSLKEIRELEKMVNKVVELKQQEFDLSLATPRQLLRFFKNAIGGDLESLSALKKFEIEFQYDVGGNVNQQPFPFGQRNIKPILDTVSSTSLNRDVRGMEKDELVIKARFADNENDFVAYRWKKEGESVSTLPLEWTWVPDFHEGRVQPYSVEVYATDGGTPIKVAWTVIVEDRNRPPVITENCVKTLTEWQPWTCRISAIDYDGDPVQFTLNDKFVKARAAVNSQLTDDTTRQVTIVGEEFIDIEFTPNNLDAKSRMGYIEVTVSDGKMGHTVVPLNLTIQDINTAPFRSAGPTSFNALNSAANEWDHCALEDPDDPGADPEVSGYRFFIEVMDPDNQDAAAPRNQHPDEVSVAFGGSIKAQLQQFGVDKGCPPPVDGKEYFCFLWRPEHNRKTGTLTLQVKDDHGGLSDIEVLNLVAEDRNVKPCLSSSQNSRILTETISTAVDAFSGSDSDGDGPQLELFGPLNSMGPVLPFLYDNTSSRYLIARRKAYDTDFKYEAQKGGDGQSTVAIRAVFNSPFAGAVVLSRGSTHNLPVVIPSGYTFETDILSSGKRIRYQTAVAATFEPTDLQLIIPVRAVNRDAAIGTLNRFIGAIPQPDLQVSNSQALTTSSATVQITRTDTTNSIVIPMGTILSTSEVADSNFTVRYALRDDVQMAAGVGSVNASIRRLQLQANANEITIMTGGALPGPTISVLNPHVAYARDGYALNGLNQNGTTLDVDNFCLTKRAADGSVEAAGTVNAIRGVSPIAGLTVTNLAAMKLDGVIQFTRPSTLTAQSVPAGTEVQTANATRFILTEAINFTPGQAVASGVVKRTNHTNPISPTQINFDRFCVGWSDMNYDPKFVNSPAAVVNEGDAILNFKFEVVDSLSDPMEPKDPADRHTFVASNQGTAPVGDWLLCRNPGTNAADISIPACQPCTNTDSTDYFGANYCYFRFKPALQDGSKTFQWRVDVNDNGMPSPVGSNIRSQFLNVSVIEHNDAPVFTDENYNNLIGNSEFNPIDIGTAVEGVTLQSFIYAKDFDLGTNLKSLGFIIDSQVYDPMASAWVAAPPGLSVAVVASDLNPAPGYGLNPPGAGTGWGSLFRARISWTPNDEGAKRFAGPDGFVLKLHVYDSVTDAAPRLFAQAYYRIRVLNNNNAPYLMPISGGFIPVSVDKYTNFQLLVRDPDYYSVGAPVNHTTNVSLCSDTSEVSCQAPSGNWPDELTSFESPYESNAGLPICRSGVDPAASLALPYIAFQSAATTSAYRQFVYAFQWCAQKSHIGDHVIFFRMTDNGDKDRAGITKAPIAITAPVNIKVTAPVFFESPGRDAVGVLNTWMKHAYASVTPQFVYPTIVNNSKKTALNYTLTTSPVLPACGEPGGMCISATGVITWQPLAALIGSQVNVTVRVQAVGISPVESDTVTFPILVRSALAPINTAPTITNYFPMAETVIVDERSNNVFQVSASDSINNYLHYRWYVNNVLKKDTGDSFSYRPGYQDGYTAGVAGLKPGQHLIRVEVTDGSHVVSRSWNVQVRNTIPSPVLSWKIGSALSGISSLNWGPSYSAQTAVAGQAINYLIFTGNYMRASVNRNFVWSLRYQDGSLASGNNYLESLPWPAGRRSERLAINMTSASSFETLITSQSGRFGPFSSTTDAVKLPITYTGLSLNSSHACTGACSQTLYTGMSGGYGSRVTASLSLGGANLFYASTANDSIVWDKDSMSDEIFYTLPNPLRVSDIAVNPNTARVYVTAKDVGSTANRIYIFDASQVGSGVAPSLVSFINVSDGVNPDNRVGDIAVNSATNKIYVNLPGTGGVAMFEDSGVGTPDEDDLVFIGVNQTGTSFNDVLQSGRKLSIDTQAGLLYGVVKDSKQVFIIDLNTNTVNVFGSEVGFDEIITYPNDKLTLGINKSEGSVYIIK